MGYGYGGGWQRGRRWGPWWMQAQPTGQEQAPSEQAGGGAAPPPPPPPGYGPPWWHYYYYPPPPPPPYYGPPPWAQPPSPEDELKALEEYKRWLEEELKGVEARIEELKKAKGGT